MGQEERTLFNPFSTIRASLPPFAVGARLPTPETHRKLRRGREKQNVRGQRFYRNARRNDSPPHKRKEKNDTLTRERETTGSPGSRVLNKSAGRERGPVNAKDAAATGAAAAGPHRGLSTMNERWSEGAAREGGGRAKDGRISLSQGGERGRHARSSSLAAMKWSFLLRG